MGHGRITLAAGRFSDPSLTATVRRPRRETYCAASRHPARENGNAKRGRQRPRRGPMPQNPQRRNDDPGRSSEDIQVPPRITPKAPNHAATATVQPIRRHGDRSRPGVGGEMFKLARKARSHDVFRRQQRQKTQNDNAAPGQQTKGSSEETRAHYRRIFLYIDLFS